MLVLFSHLSGSRCTVYLLRQNNNNNNNNNIYYLFIYQFFYLKLYVHHVQTCNDEWGGEWRLKESKDPPTTKFKGTFVS